MVRNRATNQRLHRMLFFSGILAAALVLIGSVAFAMSGRNGVVAAGLAGGSCWLAGLVSILISGTSDIPELVALRTLAGMLPRMGIPLILCFFVYLRGGVLVEAGFVYYILVFYLIALVADVGLFFRYRPENAAKTETG